MGADAEGPGDAEGSVDLEGPVDTAGNDDPGDLDDPIDWELARTVAVRAARREPYTAPRWRNGLAEEFAHCTERAEELVAECTGLRSQSGPARGRVTDRVGWIDANLASFQRLLGPLTAKLGTGSDGMLAPITRRAAGAELGVMLGWMSTPGAGPVRPAHNRGREARGPGHRLLRGPQRAVAGEQVRLRPLPVPALAGASRGDPSGPVHRRGMDAAALHRPGRVGSRLRGPRPQADRGGGPPGGGGPAPGRGPAGCRGD